MNDGGCLTSWMSRSLSEIRAPCDDERVSSMIPRGACCISLGSWLSVVFSGLEFSRIASRVEFAKMARRWSSCRSSSLGLTVVLHAISNVSFDSVVYSFCLKMLLSELLCSMVSRSVYQTRSILCS